MLREIDLLAMVLETPGALPPIVWSPPGMGKSARFSSLTKSWDWHLEVVISSIMDPSDFGGLPVPVDGNGVKREPPAWALRLNKAGKGLAFFDEASTAPPACQAAMLRVMLEKYVGDVKLGDGVKVAAAANPPEMAASGWDLSLPLANRFVHLTWTTPSADDWVEWLNGNDGMANVPRVDADAWEKGFIKAKALVSAFIHRRPGLLSEDPTKVAGRFPLAYATPRTWECATRLLATCFAMSNEEAALPLLAATIGEPIALEFATWLRANDLPDPEELLADPKKFEPDPNEPDRAFATCLAVAESALSDGSGAKKFSKAEKAKRWHAAWHVLDPAIELGKELVHLPALKLAKADKRPEKGLIDAKVREIIGKLKEVVLAAGF
jgi:hypothetical protein